MARPPLLTDDAENAAFKRRFVAVFAIALCIVAVGKIIQVIDSGVLTPDINPWASWGLFAALMIFRPSKALHLGVVVFGLALFALLVPFYPGFGVYVLPVSLGIASLIVLAVLVVYERSARLDNMFILTAGCLIPLFQMITALGQSFTTNTIFNATETLTFDQRALLVGTTLGFNAEELSQKIMHADMPAIFSFLFFVVISCAYIGITSMMGLLILLHLRRRSAGWKVSFLAFALSGLGGSLCYHLFPAVGPLYVFPNFPVIPDTSTLTLAATYADPLVPRNCMPSLHTTSALLILFNAAPLSRRFRTAAILFLVLTLVATMVTGQHYLIDLIVAFPFAVAVQLLARSIIGGSGSIVVILAILANAACVAGWMFVLVWRVEWFFEVRDLTLAMTYLSLIIPVGTFLLDSRSRNRFRREPKRDYATVSQEV